MYLKILCVIVCALFIGCAVTPPEDGPPEPGEFLTFAKLFPSIAAKEGIPELGKCYHIMEDDTHLCMIEEWDIVEYMGSPSRLVATEHDFDGVIDEEPDVYILFGIDSNGEFWIVPVGYLEYPVIVDELYKYITTENHKKSPDMVNTIPWYLHTAGAL